MTEKEAIKKFGELDPWEREKGEKMSWTAPTGIIGTHLFSFDGGKTCYSVFGGEKDELTDAQMRTFESENGMMFSLYKASRGL